MIADGSNISAMNKTGDGASAPADVAVLLPAFNEADTVAECVRSVRAAFPAAAMLVVVGGDAATELAARRVAADTPSVRVIRQCAPGKGAAIREGLAECRAAIVAQFDTDGQFAAPDLQRAVEAVRAGRADLCVGSRFMGVEARTSGSWARRIGNRLVAGWVSLLLGRRYTDVTSGLKVWRKALTDQHPLVDDGYCYELELVMRAARAGAVVLEIPTRESPRQSGSSMHHDLPGLARAGLRLLGHAWRCRWDQPATYRMPPSAAPPHACQGPGDPRA